MGTSSTSQKWAGTIRPAATATMRSRCPRRRSSRGRRGRAQASMAVRRRALGTSTRSGTRRSRTVSVKILGCSERGRTQDGPLDHATGKGRVKGVKGDYYDALFVKKSRVVPMIVDRGLRRHHSARARPHLLPWAARGGQGSHRSHGLRPSARQHQVVRYSPHAAHLQGSRHVRRDEYPPAAALSEATGVRRGRAGGGGRGSGVSAPRPNLSPRPEGPVCGD